MKEMKKENKKAFEEPLLEILILNENDVITTSGEFCPGVCLPFDTNE